LSDSSVSRDTAAAARRGEFGTPDSEARRSSRFEETVGFFKPSSDPSFKPGFFFFSVSAREEGAGASSASAPSNPYARPEAVTLGIFPMAPFPSASFSAAKPAAGATAPSPLPLARYPRTSPSAAHASRSPDPRSLAFLSRDDDGGERRVERVFEQELPGSETSRLDRAVREPEDDLVRAVTGQVERRRTRRAFRNAALLAPKARRGVARAHRAVARREREEIYVGFDFAKIGRNRTPFWSFFRRRHEVRHGVRLFDLERDVLRPVGGDRADARAAVLRADGDLPIREDAQRRDDVGRDGPERLLAGRVQALKRAVPADQKQRILGRLFGRCASARDPRCAAPQRRRALGRVPEKHVRVVHHVVRQDIRPRADEQDVPPVGALRAQRAGGDCGDLLVDVQVADPGARPRVALALVRARVRIEHEDLATGGGRGERGAFAIVHADASGVLQDLVLQPERKRGRQRHRGDGAEAPSAPLARESATLVRLEVTFLSTLKRSGALVQTTKCRFHLVSARANVSQNPFFFRRNRTYPAFRRHSIPLLVATTDIS